MKTVTLKNVVPILVALMLTSILPANAFSLKQSTESELPDMVTYYSVKEYSTYIPELRNTISLNIIDLNREEALFTIAQKADLEIAFDSGIFGEANKVSIKDNSVRVADALEYVLEGTGYESVITTRREILLKKKESVSEEEEELQTDVSGRVIDADSGEPLIGVTVFVPGTNTGTTTDAQGRFSLTVPSDADVLAFSYVGYVRQEVDLDGQTEFNIELASDVAMLDDVVVVGYGTQQREEVTGSVVSIRAEMIENNPSSSFENALQGRLAGVNVAESSGEPGAAPQITIRGTGSISAGNEPLYVIDGVPLSQNFNQQGSIGSQRASFQPPPANPLATLNPNDIESIEVLKDASAAAIYGSRGSNGVILVTTKKGTKNTAPQINVRSYIGTQSVFNEPELMNAEEVIDYTKDARNNTYLREQDPTNPASGNYNPQYDPDTNAGREANGAVGNHLIPEAYVNWDGTDTDWLDLVLEPSQL
ncbi:MAG: TonB-dependent receptor plug domain-containing protein, partial [Balneolaceae bacterium]